MPTPAYLSITGTKQGLITAGTFTQDSVGNIYQEGHEDQILVEAFQHQVIIPRDPQSGQPTGQRVHKPLMISKVFDKSSPLLFSALTSGKWSSAAWSGIAPPPPAPRSITSPSSWRTRSSSISSRGCPTARTPGNAHFTHLEDVHFTYRKIVWTHEVSGTSGSDDWRSPVAG